MARDKMGVGNEGSVTKRINQLKIIHVMTIK